MTLLFSFFLISEMALAVDAGKEVRPLQGMSMRYYLKRLLTLQWFLKTLYRKYK